MTVDNVGAHRTLRQGDAEFFRVLEEFGCQVSQSEHETTVHGPPTLAYGKTEIDASRLTDTLPTIAVVAAARPSGSVTDILKVENQRVKECNRIQALSTAFHQLGIPCEQLPTGLRVHGCDTRQRGNQHPSFQDTRRKQETCILRCHRDHRMAMSFSLLLGAPAIQDHLRKQGLSGEDFLLDDRWCVEKTFPEFWSLGKSLWGLELISPSAGGRETEMVTPSGFRGSPLVVVGMRGVGKSSLGLLAGRIHRRHVWDVDCLVDQVLEELLNSGRGEDLTPTAPGFRDLISETLHRKLVLARPISSRPHELPTIRSFLDPNPAVSQHSAASSVLSLPASERWAVFREVELQVFRQLLCRSGPESIIVCGGGIVETPEAHLVLRSHHPVVEIRRCDFRDIQTILGQDESRPGLLNSLWKSWERRKPLLEDCSDYEFAIAPRDFDWEQIQTEWLEFVERILQLNSPDMSSTPHVLQKAMMGSLPPSFFLCLNLPSVKSIDPATLKEACRGTDAVELRVDLLQPQMDGGEELETVLRTELAVLRRAVLGLPVVFTGLLPMLPPLFRSVDSVKCQCSSGWFGCHSAELPARWRVDPRSWRHGKADHARTAPRSRFHRSGMVILSFVDFPGGDDADLAVCHSCPTRLRQ